MIWINITELLAERRVESIVLFEHLESSQAESFKGHLMNRMCLFLNMQRFGEMDTQ